jgi:O-antigen ligase
LVAQLANVLYRWEWVGLFLAAPFLIFPSPQTWPALLIVPGLVIVAWLAGKDPFPRTPLSTTVLVLSTMVLVSLEATFDLALSLPKVTGMLLGIMVFYSFARYGQSARGFGLCLLTFLATGLGIAIVGLFGTNWDIKFDFLSSFTYQFAPRITGLPGADTGISPNELAGALVWVVPPALAVTCSVWRGARNQVAGIRPRRVPTGLLLVEATLFIILVFLLCQSRSAYVGLVVSGLVLIPPILGRRWQILLLAGLLVVVILAAGFTSRYGADTMVHQVVGSSVSNDPISPVYGFEGRMKVWGLALSAIQKFPVTGMGMNNFREMVNTLNPLDPPYPGKEIFHAHDEFLQAALDLGIPGLIAFVALYLGSFSILRAVWDRTASQVRRGGEGLIDLRVFPPISARALAWGLGAGLVAHLVYGLTDAVTLGAKPGVLFWMLLGLSVDLYRSSEKMPMADSGQIDGSSKPGLAGA